MANLRDRLTAALADRYSIESELGAGGMATVYLARDLRHDRAVAIKVLQPELSALLGPERFIAEIKVTANLQHPHILPLHDSGVAGALLYYVMPYVDGESLRDRLNREKQLALEECTRITRAVASALDYAHRRDVIHRDIKPENILLHDGQPMVADFGIALAVTEAGGPRLTETGISIGTPSYMSPEQAAGDRELTARSDVYSLGVVLYEMLIGDPPFTGSTVQAVIAQVVTSRPRPARELRETVPVHVEAAVDKALAKVPADRFRTAAQFGEALTPTGALATLEPVQAHTKAPASTTFRWTIEPSWLRWMLGAGALAFMALGIVQWMQKGGVEGVSGVTRFTVPVPTGHQMAVGMFPRLAMSPDGRLLVYRADGRLHVRPIGQIEAQPLIGTEGGENPFFSPDGEWIGFTQSGMLKKIPAAGGPAIGVTMASGIFGASWGGNGEIVYAAAIGDAGLRRVSAEGGTAESFTIPDDADETFHLWPQVLPGSDLVLFTVLGPSSGWNESRIDAKNLTTGDRWTVVEGGTYGRYVPTGHILYAQASGVILALPYDLAGREATGPARPVLDGVRVAVSAGAASFAVSDNGTLAFVDGSTEDMRLLQWVDRDGTTLNTLGSPVGALSQFQISPDSRRVALTIREPNNDDVWLLDAASGEPERFTFDGVEDETPVWSPDGRRIAYSSAWTGQRRRIYIKDVDGRADPRLVFTGQRHLHLTSWSGDGRWLAFDELHPESRSNVWVLDLEDSENVLPVARTPAGELGGVFSPDGHWLVYQSDESGRPEIYAVSFPQLSGKRQVSTDGGAGVKWPRGGPELFYRGGGELMRVAASTGELFSRDMPRPLFQARFLEYDVAPNGQRFLVSVQNPDALAREIQVVVNWFEELQAAVAGQ